MLLCMRMHASECVSNAERLLPGLIRQNSQRLQWKAPVLLCMWMCPRVLSRVTELCTFSRHGMQSTSSPSPKLGSELVGLGLVRVLARGVWKQGSCCGCAQQQICSHLCCGSSLQPRLPHGRHMYGCRYTMCVCQVEHTKWKTYYSQCRLANHYSTRFSHMSQMAAHLYCERQGHQGSRP